VNDIANPTLPVIREDDPMASVGRLWPSPEYTRQVERLRAAVGETIYLVEIAATEVQLGIRLTGKPYVLLGLVDFPRPDPLKGLAPHLILLDDGRGVNLGRIARITREHPFNPAPADLLFQDREASQALLAGSAVVRRLHRAARQGLLGEVLGVPTAPHVVRLSGPGVLDEPPDAGRCSCREVGPAPGRSHP
jgi:hypothetical protein